MATAKECGYPLEWFAEPVPKKYRCGICSQVLRYPAATPCGHIYCSRCLSTWVSCYGVCPERCRELEVHLLERVVHIDHLISGLAVRCKNRPAGCRVTVTLAEKSIHEASCAYARPSNFRRLLTKASLSQQDIAGEDRKLKDAKIRHKRTKSSTSRINAVATAKQKACRRSPSSAAALCRPSTAVPLSSLASSCAMPIAMVSACSSAAHQHLQACLANH